MNIDEAIQVFCIIDKLSPSWKDFKHTLKHNKEELTLVALGSHLRNEESLMVQDSDKPKGNNVVDEALDKFKVFKTEVELQQGSLIKRFRTDRGGVSQGLWGEAMLTACYLLNRVPNKRNKITPYKLWTKRNPNLNYLRIWGCRAVHFKAFRFYVIEPNELVSINSIIESNDAIFNENRFSSVPRPSLRIPNGTKDIGGSVVPQEVVTQQPEPDEVSDQHFYYFKVEDDSKTFDEVMKSQDVAFWKKAINDEMDSIMGNNTGCWLIYLQAANLMRLS
ncbi:zinc finger, CCHC-type containing protein [Tanacetum coccineum]